MLLITINPNVLKVGNKGGSIHRYKSALKMIMN